MEAEDEIPRYRTLLCAVQTGGKYFGKLLQNMCENTVHKTFYNVLDENFYKHDILHLWKNDKCCLCGVSTVHHYAGSLKQRQILSVYSTIDRKCGRIPCKFCPCSFKAKEGVCTSNTDITFSHALLSRVFLKSVHPSLPTCNVRRAIDEIKEIRNTAVHYPENPLHKVDFDKEWLNLKSSLLIICKYLKESTDMLEEEMEKFHYLVNTCKDCSFRIKASLERMKNGELKDSNDNGIVGNPFQMFAVCQDCARIQEGCKDAQSLIFDNLHLFMGLTPYEFLPDLEEAGALTEEDVRHIKSLDKRAKQMEAFLSILKERGISSCRKTLDILAEKDYGPAIRKMRKEKKAGCEITFAVNGNFDIEEVNALKQKTTDHTTEQSSGIGRYNLRFSVLSPQKDKTEKILKDFIESEDFSSKLNDMGPGDISVTDGSVIVHLRFKCQEDYDKFSVALSEGKLFDIVSRMWDEVKYNHQIDKQDANMIVYIQNVPGRLANSGKTECSAAFFIDTNNEFLTEELCPGTLIKYLKESHHDISEAIRIRKEHPFNRRAQSQELLKFLRNESFEFIQKCIIATQPETIKRKLEESMSSVHAVLETENKEKETMVENTLLQTGTDDIMREKEIHNQCSDCRRRQRSNKLLETVSCNACVMQDHATELLPSMFELYTIQQPVKATEMLRGNADRNVLAEPTILYEREERNGATAKPEVLYKREHTKPTPNLNLFDDDFDAKAELTTTCDVYTESNATNDIDDHSDSDESVVSQCFNPESGQRRSTRRRGRYRGREQFDPNDPTKVTETMQLTKGQIVMLKIGRVSQKAPECKFDLDASQEKVVIQGETYEKVTGAKIEIRQLLNNLKEHSVREDQDIVKLFSSSRGSGFVRSTLKKNKTRAFVGFKVNSSEMFAYAYSMKEAKAAVTLIDSWIGRHECIVNDNHSTYLSSPEWNAYMVRSQKENLVSIRVNVNEKKIFITGVKAVVDATADEVNTKLSSVDRASDVGGRTVDISLNRPYRDTSSDHTETTTGGVNKVESSMGAHQHDRQSDGRKYTEKIKVEEGYARCLKKNRNLIYDQAKSKDWISDIDIKVKKKGQVTIEGTDQSFVWKAKQCIEEVLKNVWKGDLDLGRISKDDKDKAIMSHSLLSAKCGEFIKMFEQQYACGVIISPGHQRLTLPPSHSTPDLSHLNSSSPRPPHRSASTSALQSADHRSSHSDSPDRAPYVPHTPRLDRVESLPSHHIETARSQPSGQNETVVIQKGNFKAVLKKGKIVEERAKILVNFFGVNGNHGVISDSFKRAGGDAFNQGLTNITGESISPLSGGTLPCQYVLNIVLETYRNAQHLQMLQSRIEECFTWCGTLGATSVAFPAVGVGRLLRYPAEDVARIMKEEAERALDQSPRLQSLSFVIFDDETYGKFQRVMTNLHSRQTGLALSGPLVLPSRQGMEVQHHPEVRGRRHDYQGRRRSEDYGRLDRNEDRHHDVHRGHRYSNRDSYSNSKDRDNYHDRPRRHHGDDGYHRNKHHHDNNNKSDKPQGNENIPEAIVTLYCKDRNSGESCRGKLSKEIRDRFLSEEECDVPFGDKEGKRTVYKICNKHNVFVAEVEKDKKKTIPVLKGEKSAVDKATKEILRHFASGDGSKEVRRKRNNEHSRGTKQYWKFYADEPPTPKYWRHFKDGVGLVDALRNWIGKARVERYDVDPKTFNAIKTLVEKTWVPKAGVGADAKNLNHSKLKVRKVERIENINLYKKYAEKRKELFARLSTGGSVKKLEAIQPSGSAGNCKPILTANIDDRMNSDVFPEMNEYYLFHGTKSDLEDNIIHKGFDQRYCGDNAMFGRGVYAAESSTKADQYADDKDNRRKSNLHMFLVRVLLGEMYVSNVPKRFDLPPCRNCRSEKCADPKHHPYDSVVGDGKWLFREFVVYSQDQCYPEYVITYDRT